MEEKNRFSLYILVKAIVKFNLEISCEMMEKFKVIILSNDEIWVKQSNPWQVIYKYLAIMFFNKNNNSIAEICIKNIGLVVKDREKELTLHIISLYNEIEARYICSNNEIVLKNKIEDLKVTINKNKNINKYLESFLEGENIENILRELKRKLVFTYS